MARSLTISDGQLAASATTLLSGVSMPTDGRRVDVICQNTGTGTETVVLTFQRAGGTARRLFRCELAENEQLLASGVPVQGDDTLLGVTSTASTVDYLVMASSVGSMRFEVLSANGTSKGVATMRSILLGVETMVGGELPDPG